MDKLKLAHEYAIEMAKQGIPLKSCKELGWKYADAMQAEADERKKAEAAQKRKEVREILNDANTFIEREGQHFDDLTPTWDQGPNVLTTEDAEKYKNMIKREFDLYNNPQPKIEKRKSIHAEESDWQPDWSQAPETAIGWKMQSKSNAVWIHNKSLSAFEYSIAPTFDYQGNWQDSLRKRPEALCEVDWSVAPCWAKDWVMLDGVVKWECGTYANSWEDAPSFGFTGSHIVERPNGF